MDLKPCKCGESFARSGGFGDGIYYSHDVDRCTRFDSRTWRQRLLWPVAAFFRHLAGPAKPLPWMQNTSPRGS